MAFCAAVITFADRFKFLVYLGEGNGVVFLSVVVEFRGGGGLVLPHEFVYKEMCEGSQE